MNESETVGLRRYGTEYSVDDSMTVAKLIG
jgi:hypothetical protein